jgi:hypothetical protein
LNTFFDINLEIHQASISSILEMQWTWSIFFLLGYEHHQFDKVTKSLPLMDMNLISSFLTNNPYAVTHISFAISQICLLLLHFNSTLSS